MKIPIEELANRAQVKRIGDFREHDFIDCDFGYEQRTFCAYCANNFLEAVELLKVARNRIAQRMN